MSKLLTRQLASALIWLGLAPAAIGQPTFPKPARYEPTEDERKSVEERAAKLNELIKSLPGETPHEAVADVSVYSKGAAWLLRFNEFYDKKDVASALTILDRGLERASALKTGKTPWNDARGWIARGYVSKVDGSIQPYAVVVPEGLELSRDKRVRLDVVLHGRNATGSEVRFLASNDAKPAKPEDAGKLTLHVFGRTNNAYRWAGEADVFEAIESVKRHYPVDDQRIVLRGFSMGGAGAWHMGLHHPALWSSVEAGAGFSETRNYAKLGKTSAYVDKALHIYDSVDYALNAFNVPIAGYGGEDDPQLQASNNIVEALRTLGFTLETDGLITRGKGIDFLRVVGARMGHKVDPASAKILSAFHDEHAKAGVNQSRERIRFVTYTVKYGRAQWLAIEAMNEHFTRAEIDAEIKDDKVVVHKVENVAVLSVDRRAAEKIAIGGKEFDLEGAAGGLLPDVYFRRGDNGEWRQLDHNESRAFEENVGRNKCRNVQGPVDDAFTGPFLCVRGTGTPWSPAVSRWTTARLDRFVADWAVSFRGDLSVKDDRDVTPDDIANRSLILFGDPGSNSWITRVLKDLPLTWTRDSVVLKGETFTPTDHVPVLIAPNPLNPRHYIVLNSGHTFGAVDFQGTNALLYPRLGDFGVFQTDGKNETLKTSGYFDEGWSKK